MMPLAEYLRTGVSNAKVETIELGRSLKNFDSLVDSALKQIDPLIQNGDVEKIILIGFSHGGRIAVAVKNALDRTSPRLQCDVIIMATPIARKPANILWYKKILYNLSAAFREWPTVKQPIDSSCKYTCFYSENDEVVDAESAKTDFTGELTKIDGLTHKDFMRPEKFGIHLLNLINRKQKGSNSIPCLPAGISSTNDHSFYSEKAEATRQPYTGAFLSEIF